MKLRIDQYTEKVGKVIKKEYFTVKFDVLLEEDEVLGLNSMAELNKIDPKNFIIFLVSLTEDEYKTSIKLNNPKNMAAKLAPKLTALSKAVAGTMSKDRPKFEELGVHYDANKEAFLHFRHFLRPEDTEKINVGYTYYFYTIALSDLIGDSRCSGLLALYTDIRRENFIEEIKSRLKELKDLSENWKGRSIEIGGFGSDEIDI